MVYCKSVVVTFPVIAFLVALPSAVTVLPVKEEYGIIEENKVVFVHWVTFVG